jgi:hypothetical protein
MVLLTRVNGRPTYRPFGSVFSRSPRVYILLGPEWTARRFHHVFELGIGPNLGVPGTGPQAAPLMPMGPMTAKRYALLLSLGLMMFWSTCWGLGYLACLNS